MTALPLRRLLGCWLFAAILALGCSRKAPVVDPPAVEESGADPKPVAVQPTPKAPSERPADPKAPSGRPADPKPTAPVVSREPTPDLAAGQTVRGTLRARYGTRTHTFNTAQFTPDGLHLVGGGYGPGAIVWDLKTGEEAGRLTVFKGKEGDPLGIRRAFLSPDGATVLTMANRSGGLLLWDRAKAAVRVPLKSEDSLTQAAYTPDSKTLFVKDNNQGISRWDVATGEMLAKSAKIEGMSSDSDLVVSPDGNTVGIGGEKGDIILFEGETLKEKKRWPAHKRSLNGLAFSPDGKMLASIAANEDLVKLWDLEKGSLIRSIKREHGEQPTVAFSPSGKILASGGRAITLWDVKSGAELTTFYGHSDDLHSLAFSPDGSLLAGTPSSQRGVVVWEMSNGLEKRSVARGERDHYLALAPGGTRALLKTAKGAELRDMATGKALWTVAAESLSAPTFSPDGKLFAFSKTRDKLTFIDAGTGTEKATIELPGTFSIQSVIFRPDSKRLAVGSYSDVQFCDLGDKPKASAMPKLSVKAETMAFHPTGKTLAVSVGPTLRLFEEETGKALWSVPAHEGRVSVITFSPDGTRILTVCQNEQEGAVRLWDAKDGKQIAVFRHEQYPTDAFFNEEGRTVITTDYQSNLYAWDASSGKRIGRFPAPKQVSHLLFAPDRKTFFTIGDKKLNLYETAAFTREAIAGRAGLPPLPEKAVPVPVYAPARLLRGPGESIGLCGFSADGKRMVTVDGKQRATVWDVPAGKPVRSFAFDTGPAKPYSSFATGLSADGKSLVIGCWDGTVRLVDVETGKQRHAMKGHERFVRVVAFSPDGRYVASVAGGSDEMELFLWDAMAGKQVKPLAKGRGTIDGLAFTPDGKTLVAAAHESGVRVFDVESGRERPRLEHTEYVLKVAVSPDGALVAATGGFPSPTLNDVTIWDLNTGRLLHNLKGQSYSINGLAFGPGGLLVGRGAGTHLWDARTGKSLRHLSKVAFSALSPDGKWMAAQSERGLELFDVVAIRDDRLQAALAPILRLGGTVGPEGDGLRVEIQLPGGPDSIAAMAGLEALPELRSLKIENETMPAAVVASIAKMKSLRSLTINNSDIDDALVARLAGLAELTTLDLFNCRNVTVAGFAPLAKLSKLERLRLAATQMTAPGLVPLVGLKGLRSLDVSGAEVRSEGLEVLTKFPALEELNLGSRLEDDGLEKLKGLTKLRSLLLEDSNVSDAGLAHLGKMAALEKLDLSRTKITDAGLAHLKPLTNLKGLNLAYTPITDAGFAHLAGLTKLTSISINGMEKFTGAGLQHLSKATGLTALNLNGTGVTDAGLVGLKDWTHLVSLELPETIGDAGLLHLAKLTKLETINLLRLKGLKGPGLAGLKDATAITSLDLRSLPITDAGLDGLKEWKHLVELRLPKDITDSGLAKLAGLKSLKLLEVNGAKGVTDAGLEHLKGLVDLVNLDLRETKITDAGLAKLEGLTKLGHLYVGSTGVTKAGIENLKKKLPDVSISTF